MGGVSFAQRTTQNGPIMSSSQISQQPSPHQAPHVYRNTCTGTWICDVEGTRARPGPDSARTVCRSHLEAVLVALSMSAPR